VIHWHRLQRFVGFFAFFILDNYSMKVESMSERLPILIEPCPIVDATAELRFEAAVPPAVAVGLLYERVLIEFPKVSALPTIPFPDELRKSNPALMHQAQYRFESESFVVLIGPNVFAIGVNGRYTKWPIISRGFRAAFDLLRDTNIVGVPKRFGLKYMNFFPGNVFPNLNITLGIADAKITGEEIFLQATVLCQPFKILLQLATGTKITSSVLPIDPNMLGTLLTLDCFKDQASLDSEFLANISENLDLAHAEEKQLFFRLLKNEFLQKLNPQYAA
jgi:uncharacterized protein (TIGR04255 family)